MIDLRLALAMAFPITDWRVALCRDICMRQRSVRTRGSFPRGRVRLDALESSL